MLGSLLSLLVVGALPLALGACDASFTDLRDRPPERDGGALDTEPGSGDSAIGSDGFTAADGAFDPAVGPIARGPWEGRGGYSAEGTAELVVDDSGGLTLRFSDDFSVSSVPGPVVLLSSRAAIGTAIDPATDLHLGTLQAEGGAQTYTLPAPAEDRRVAWIYCEPFGIEVGRATLVEER
jgi:hypothetical protein